MDMIDRTSAEPYYQQLARIIESRITSGDYKAGERVPGETELCRTYDLARSTVRETLRALEQQKLIRVVPRRGAFVIGVSDNHWKLQVTEGFLEASAHSPDRQIVTTVLNFGFKPLPHFAAAALGLKEGESGFVLERLRRVDGKVAIHSQNYLPADVGASLLGKPVTEGKASLNQTLRQNGFAIYAARREVAAVAAPAEIARQLGVEVGAPLLLIESISRAEDGRAFDFYRSHVRSDVVSISVDAVAHIES